MSGMAGSMITASKMARPMLRVLAGLFLCGNALAQAQEFSAYLVRSQMGAAPAPAGRLIVHGDNVRIETPELPDGFFLIDGAKPAAYFVRPSMHLYMEARQSTRLTSWFVPVDPNDPCRQWQAMARLAGALHPDGLGCERTGEDVIGGRRLIAYRVTAGASEQFLGWIDPIDRFPLQIRTKDGDIVSVENIQDAPQPLPSLQVPQGFRKFDPEMILRQVKQSDVWVAPPE
jgi:hypothetical protein